MSLLATLDYHFETLASGGNEASEVEYLLDSWGEIFPPFIGNREHSIAARFILTEFPFKLFSSTNPYDGPFPYRLTVTFRAPHRVREQSEEGTFGGLFPDEIAQSFAEFLAVVTRRRVFPSRLTRQDGLPIIWESTSLPISTHHEPQPLKEIDPEVIQCLLRNLQTMDRKIARSFVLSIGLYHAAIELMPTRSELAYILLITALEAIASAVYTDFTHPREDDFLDSTYPGWRDVAGSADQEAKIRQLLLRNERFTFAKLAAFVDAYLPEKFWTDEIDDAKPERLSAWVAAGPDGEPIERIERGTGKIEDWEKIERPMLQKVLRCVYAARSKLVHEGLPFPASIVIGMSRRVPADAVREMLRAASSGGTDKVSVPPILVFERLVSYCLVEYLARVES